MLLFLLYLKYYCFAEVICQELRHSSVWVPTFAVCCKIVYLLSGMFKLFNICLFFSYILVDFVSKKYICMALWKQSSRLLDFPCLNALNLCVYAFLFRDLHCLCLNSVKPRYVGSSHFYFHHVVYLSLWSVYRLSQIHFSQTCRLQRRLLQSLSSIC